MKTAGRWMVGTLVLLMVVLAALASADTKADEGLPCDEARNAVLALTAASNEITATAQRLQEARPANRDVVCSAMRLQVLGMKLSVEAFRLSAPVKQRCTGVGTGKARELIAALEVFMESIQGEHDEHCNGVVQ